MEKKQIYKENLKKKKQKQNTIAKKQKIFQKNS